MRPKLTAPDIITEVLLGFGSYRKSEVSKSILGSVYSVH